MSAAPLAATVAALMPRARTELAELVSYRSVADPRQFPKSECERAATWIADALRTEGFEDVALLDTPDGTQSVYGYLPGPEGAPTVLLYAHYDVQPPLDETGWLSPPFELTERDGRWYGRGAADCKGGLIMHLTALRALRENGGVPVGVKIIAEGSRSRAPAVWSATRRSTRSCSPRTPSSSATPATSASVCRPSRPPCAAWRWSTSR